jgi:hypothetical protein
MPGSRTIKTLTALLVAMTIGSFALMLLDTDPIRATNQKAVVSYPNEPVAKLIAGTRIPIRNTWRNIVIHSSANESADFNQKCHFVVELDASGAPTVTATELWDRQLDGNHVFVAGGDWNSDSIGIVMAGDFSRNKPTKAQAEALRKLIAVLQEKLNIRNDHVYAHSQLDSRNRNCVTFYTN